MFEGKIINVSELVKTLKPISSVISEIALTLGEDGWSISSCDTAMTTMFKWTFSKNKFSEYNLKEKAVAKVNLQKLLSVLERFEYAEIVINQTKIILTDTNKTFIIPQITMEDEDQPKPTIDFTTSFITTIESLSDVMKDVGMLADMFFIEVTKEKVSIDAKSDTDGSFSSKLEAENIETKEVASSSFSSDLVKPILNKYFIKAKIEMIDQGPMKITLEGDGVKQSLLIAPRLIEN